MPRRGRTLECLSSYLKLLVVSTPLYLGRGLALHAVPIATRRSEWLVDADVVVVRFKTRTRFVDA